MGRYIKKFTRVGSMGPTEERGFAIWAGYDIAGVDGDLSELGLIDVGDWPAEKLAQHGVKTFLRIEPDDDGTYEKLGIPRRR
jgi:hypothetical protein